ncbi:hypothetical protein EVAR_74825_1 [Eumeta japonica]|uniref:Uncharacterized protein n=1 Tax=Eumeta variegata TaxID=151549 RepID=A0A4C1SQ40_EUMVA|nr:hypothetical protein EVAR_74825_1 [Eumeta japonica]
MISLISRTNYREPRKVTSRSRACRTMLTVGFRSRHYKEMHYRSLSTGGLLSVFAVTPRYCTIFARNGRYITHRDDTARSPRRVERAVPPRVGTRRGRGPERAWAALPLPPRSIRLGMPLRAPGPAPPRAPPAPQPQLTPLIYRNAAPGEVRAPVDTGDTPPPRAPPAAPPPQTATPDLHRPGAGGARHTRTGERTGAHAHAARRRATDGRRRGAVINNAHTYRITNYIFIRNK